MITIPHKKGVINKTNQKKIPNKFVARVSDGTNWVYYETQEEYDAYKASKPIVEEEIEVIQENPLLKALKEATPEEIQELKNLLNN